MNLWRCLCFAAIVTWNGAASAADLFPFRLPWDDASVNLTNLSAWNDKPAGKAGFVRAENGHLYAGAERIRFLGVNIVFAGAAPASRDEADRLAAGWRDSAYNRVDSTTLNSATAPRGRLQKTDHPGPEASVGSTIFSLMKREGSMPTSTCSRPSSTDSPTGARTLAIRKGIDNFHPR